MSTTNQPASPLNASAVRAALAAAAIVFLAGLWRALPDMVDDAYITFHCVKNFVHHGQLTFNLGTRVEAFSNPLFAFLLIPFEVLGIPLPIAARLLGFAAFGGAVALVHKLIVHLHGDRQLALLGAACTLASFPFLYYSITGLETGLFGTLLLALVARLIFCKRGGVLDALLVLSVLLSRPEAPLYIALLFTAAILPRFRENRTLLLMWVTGGLAFLAMVVIRRVYYGLWLPNPFYAKAPGTADLDPATSAFGASMSYLLEFLWRCGFVIPVLAVVAALLHVREAAFRILGCVVLACVIFAAYTGGDWFPASRYLLPMLPAMIVAGVVGFARLAARTKVSTTLLAMGLFVSVLASSVATLVEFTLWRNRYPYHVMNGSDCARAGRWMRDNLAPDTHIVAYRIGALGYETGFTVIDLLGLADHDIAMVLAATPEFHPARTMGSGNPAITAIVLRERPDAVLAVQPAEIPPTARKVLYGMTFTFIRSFPQGTDQQWVLYRRDVPPTAPPHSQ